MLQTEILEELKRLAPAERLAIVEAALHSIREDLRGQPAPQKERKRLLESAAKALLPDYATGGELTIFTALDGEDFHAEG